MTSGRGVVVDDEWYKHRGNLHDRFGMGATIKPFKRIKLPFEASKMGEAIISTNTVKGAIGIHKRNSTASHNTRATKDFIQNLDLIQCNLEEDQKP